MKNIAVHVLIGAVLGLALFFLGYIAAVGASRFEISEAILGAAVGGILAIGASTVTGFFSKDATLQAATLAHELETNRVREAWNREKAGGLIQIIGQIDEFASLTCRNVTQSNPQMPDWDAIDASVRDLKNAAASYFPELDDIILHWAGVIWESSTKVIELFEKAVQGATIDIKQMHLAWHKSDAYLIGIRKYLMERYIRNQVTPVPTTGNIELISAVHEARLKASL